MEIKEIEGSRVLVEIAGGKSVWLESVWLDKAVLRRYGVKSSDIKVGAKFKA